MGANEPTDGASSCSSGERASVNTSEYRTTPIETAQQFLDGAREFSQPRLTPRSPVSSAFPTSPNYVVSHVFPSRPARVPLREQHTSSSLATSRSSDATLPPSPKSTATSLSWSSSPKVDERDCISVHSSTAVRDDRGHLLSEPQRPALPSNSRSEPVNVILSDARPIRPRFLSQSALSTSSPSSSIPNGSATSRVSTLLKRGLFGRSKTDQPKNRSQASLPIGSGSQSQFTAPSISSRAPLSQSLSLPTTSTYAPGPRLDSPQPLPSHSPSLRSVSPVYQSYFDQQPLEAARTWKSSLDNDTIVHLTLQHGHDEMHRQEVIFEIIETEQAFVDSMTAILEIYGQTIRDKAVDGVPRSVTRLFSRLERILDLHVRLTKTLAVAADTQNAGRLVMHFADLFAPYVAEFEVYQAYLLRFEAVTAVLDHESASGMGPFAAFLQENARRPEAAGLSLSSFLLKPIQRLMKYPLFFARLLDVTSPSHPDFAATSDLSDDMDEMVRALQDVKLAEEEYEALKVLENSLVGLPDDFKLAERGRTLLFEGTVRQLHVNDRERIALDLLCGSSGLQRQSLRPRKTSDGILHSSLAPPPGLAATPPRPSDCGDVTVKGRPSLRASGSNASLGCPSASVVSASPERTVAAARSPTEPRTKKLTTPPASPDLSSGIGKSLRAPPVPAPHAVSKRSLFNASPPKVADTAPVRSSAKLSSPKIRLRAKESSLHVWIFRDVMLFARREETGRLSKAERGNLAPHRHLLDGVGVARLWNFRDKSRKTADHDNLLEVAVEPWRAGPRTPGEPVSLYLAPPLRQKSASGRPSSASSSFSRSSTMSSFSSKISTSTGSAATVMPDVDLATFSNLYAALRLLQTAPNTPEIAPSLGSDYWTSRVRKVKADMRARRQTFT
ncbi:hypothetical protein JCM10908_005994 [Rhodotorula pacifica]|uniref:uncharacterized protein n=1 Tax=Rhodotorula pacifica TaxID=1495444 RepID=UPI0031720E9D